MPHKTLAQIHLNLESLTYSKFPHFSTLLQIDFIFYGKHDYCLLKIHRVQNEKGGCILCLLSNTYFFQVLGRHRDGCIKDTPALSLSRLIDQTPVGHNCTHLIKPTTCRHTVVNLLTIRRYGFCTRYCFIRSLHFLNCSFIQRILLHIWHSVSFQRYIIL